MAICDGIVLEDFVRDTSIRVATGAYGRGSGVHDA
jgi:hypothetical protein